MITEAAVALHADQDAASRYRPQLDGVRAFCIIFTVLNHVPGTPAIINGSVGVDIFFALSGWLITWLLLQERKRTGSLDLRSFYIRRIFRILPLYLVVLAAYCFVAYVLHLGGPSTSREMDRAFAYLATMNSEYRPDSAGNIYGHAWTLGIEEKFYLFWPALMLLAGCNRMVSWALAIGLAILFAYLAPHFGLVARGYFGLGFGALLASLVHRNASLQGRLAHLSLGWAILAALAVAYAASLRDIYDYRVNMVVSALGGLLIATIWFNAGQGVSRFLSIRPLAFLGRLTYALYLIHVLAVNVVIAGLQKLGVSLHWSAIFAITYAVAIVGAIVLHEILEKPMITAGRRIVSRRRAAGKDLVLSNGLISPEQS